MHRFITQHKLQTKTILNFDLQLQSNCNFYSIFATCIYRRVEPRDPTKDRSTSRGKVILSSRPFLANMSPGGKGLLRIKTNLLCFFVTDIMHNKL